MNPDSEAARAVSMGQKGIVADISGTEVLVDFADNKFPFDRDQIARVSTARSSAGEGGPAVVQLDHCQIPAKKPADDPGEKPLTEDAGKRPAKLLRKHQPSNQRIRKVKPEPAARRTNSCGLQARRLAAELGLESLLRDADG